MTVYITPSIENNDKPVDVGDYQSLNQEMDQNNGDRSGMTTNWDEGFRKFPLAGIFCRRIERSVMG